MVFAGREEVWFAECLLSSAEAAEEPLLWVARRE